MKKFEKLFNLFFAKKEVTEIRAIGLQGKGPWDGWAKGTVGGYYDDAKKFAQDAAKLEKNGQAAGIYFTPNPVKPALLARAANRMKAADITTSDRDIACLRWLLIDTDPERPAGISATQEEEQRALAVRDQIASWLETQGWPEPIVARSGNGGHLLYRIPDLEPSRENIELLKRCLQALAEKFSTPDVKVDEKVFNPARIWKLYGTTGRKGDSTEDRPHRQSQVQKAPKDRAATATIEMIEALAAEAPAPDEEPARQPRRGQDESNLGPVDVGAYLRHYGYDYRTKNIDAGELYILNPCLFDPSHTGKEAGIIQHHNGMLSYQCFHDSCDDKTWHMARKIISGEDKLAKFCEGYDPAKFRSTPSAATPAPQKPAGDPSHNGASRYFSGKRFLGRLLGKDILTEMDLLYVPDVGTFRYNGEFWEFIHDTYIHGAAAAKLGDENSTRNRITEACFFAQTESRIQADQELNQHAGRFVCLKNGMLDLGTGELLKHHKKYLATIQIQANYDPEADCPRWRQYWKETLDDPRKERIMQEWTGYCMTRNTHHHKALFLVGPGQDGKSTYLKILEHLVGHEARTNVTLRDLENEFHRVTLFGKTLNVSTETEFRSAMTSDWFKAIVSGDSISAAHKNRPVFSFTPFCKMAFGMNQLPRSSDYTFGFYRRIIIIQYTRQFLGEAEDKHLHGKLVAEIDGIFNWALKGLERLEQQGGFTESEEVAELVRQYRIDSAPALTFVEDECTTKARPDGSLPDIEKEKLYEAYVVWCKAHGARELGVARFHRQIKDVYSHIKDERRGTGAQRSLYLIGIGLKPIGADNGDDVD